MRTSGHLKICAESYFSRVIQPDVTWKVLLSKMDFVEVAAAAALILRSRNKRRRKQRPWVDPIVSQRLLDGEFNKLFTELRMHQKKFFCYFRMNVESFDKLLSAVGPRIRHQNTILRLAVPPEERLAVTLRYLATGDSFHSLHDEYLLGTSTITKIVRDTCDAIWECLLPDNMPTINDREDWLRIANVFYARTSFPNCIGAVDAKFVRIRKKTASGSYLSVVLTAVTDADYSFIAVEVGTHDFFRDGDIFKRSDFGHMLNKGELDIPNARCLPNDHEGSPMPFVVVGSEAFATSDNILCPYQDRSLLVDKCIFNHRIKRASGMTERCFGLMVSKWHILHRLLDVNVEFCCSIVRAVCMLHNFVRKNEGIRPEDMYESSLECIQPDGTGGGAEGMKTRDYFTQYFTSSRGSVPWQYKKACLV